MPMHCSNRARLRRVLTALILPLACAMGAALAGDAPAPPPDTVPSPTLTRALGPLLDKIIAEMKADGRIPAAEDVAAKMKEIKEALPNSPLVYATPEQEKEFSAGNFNDEVATRRAGVFLKQLDLVQALNVDLPAPSLYAMKEIKAGRLKGVELELGVRILKFTYEKLVSANKVVVAGKPDAPPAFPPGTVSEDEDKNKVYTNEAAGLAIIFPPDWEVKDNPVPGHVVGATSPKEENDDFVEKVNVAVFNSGKKSLQETCEDFLTDMKATPNFKLLASNDATIGGVEGKVLNYTVAQVRGATYFAIKGETVVNINCTSSTESFERFKESFDWVIETVKFGEK